MKARPLSRRRARPPQLCLGPGCGVEIPRWKRFCDACWPRVPRDLKARIIDAGRARAPHQVSALAIEAAGRIRAAESATARRLGEREETE